MQIIFSDWKKGEVKVLTQALDDLWALYNIIKPGDLVSGWTHRRVVMREGDKGERKAMTLQIKVENVEFHEYSNRLRVKGQITQGPDDYVSLGQYHTINVEINSKIKIIKEKWYNHEKRRLRKSLDKEENKLVAVIAVESGNATLGLISNYSLNISTNIRHNIPGKRFSKQNAKKELKKFFDQIYRILREKVDKFEIPLVVIVGPGFTKERLQKHLNEKFELDNTEIDMRVASASSGTDSAIYEVLKNGQISKIIANHKMSQESQYMEDFYARMGKDEGTYTYGVKETLKAAEMGAIETLLVTDKLMRQIVGDEQQQIEKLFNYVEKTGGEIHILSTFSPAGEQLDKYGGCVSLLRFQIQ